MSNDADANKRVVTRFFGALNDGRFEEALSLADGSSRWSIPRKRQVGTIGDQIALIRTEYMTFDVGTLTAEEDRVAAIVSGAMRRPGEAVLEKSYHFLIRVADGRIVDVCMYDDGGLPKREEVTA
jgi:ketosteroid isomerase-like protein